MVLIPSTFISFRSATILAYQARAQKWSVSEVAESLDIDRRVRPGTNPNVGARGELSDVRYKLRGHGLQGSQGIASFSVWYS